MRRLAVPVVLGALVAASALACAKRPPAARRVPSAAPALDEPPAARAIASVLASVHARISLAAPAWELQPLCFGRHLLVRLVKDQVEVIALPELATAFEAPLVGARGVVEIAGGSVVAVGAKLALRLDAGAKAPVRLPVIPWIPGTLLLPERRDSNLLWAVQRAGKQLFRQRLVLDPTRAFDKEITLEGYDGGPLAALRDGALLYRSTDGVRRALPEGRPQSFAPDFAPWRLLPGPRIDEAWAIGEDGRVELWQLAERLLVKARFAAGAPPFSAAANLDYLALVLVDEPGVAERRFRLRVFQNDGTPALERALPPGPPEIGEDWTEVAVRDRQVAISETEPLVAVGGPGSLEAFRLPTGERVLTR
ncbi:MAG TPA: hypothetical protein VLJ38_04205 [Polyangiaceae bacterium]|nr:hypothetical protein [Polyangiaceae bacterium]